MFQRAHLVIVGLVVLCLTGGPATTALPAAESASARAATHAQLARMPLRFEANAGQWDPRVRFVAHERGATLFITDDGMTIGLRDVTMRDNPRTAEVTMKLVGVRPSAPVGEEELVTKSNFFIGDDPAKWRTNVPSFAEVRAKDWLSGVNVVWHGGREGLEYDLEVAAKADASLIALDVEGATALSVSVDGSLQMTTPAGTLVQKPPRVMQDGKQLRTRYRVAGEHRVAFDIDDYDRNRPVVIDPTLLYSTFLGGSYSDQAFYGLAVDSSGATYVTGTTQSSNFPTTAGSYQPTYVGPQGNAFVAKLDASGSLVWATYLGGSKLATGSGLAVDGTGNVYVTGNTGPNFPTTTGSYQPTFGGTNDAFVSKLDSSGASLLYSTYLGGSAWDDGVSIAIDASGNAYVTGDTGGSFPTTTGAYQTTYGGGGYDVFVAKLGSTGATLSYATYAGGTGLEIGRRLVVDSSNQAVVAGITSSTNYPTTTGAYQTSYGGGSDDGFVTKLDASGASLVFSTYLGGTGIDQVVSLTLDSNDDAYLVGNTNGPFPTTTGVYQTTLGGAFDSWVAKLVASGASLAFSTYVGATGNDYTSGIARDPSGNIWITGNTDDSHYLVTNDGYQKVYGGSIDGFVTELSPSATSLLYATYLGGSGQDYVTNVALDSNGIAHLAGYTGSSGFPTTTGALQTTYGGGNYDAFIALLGGAALVLNPSSATAPPKGGVSFSASGGSGTGYTYSLATNASGGSINSSTGDYTAGATGSVTDVVEVTDSANDTATANVTVGAGVSVSPSNPTSPPKGAVSFSASDGSGTGYTFALTTNGSGGSINASTGAYTAGATGGVDDVVTATDSLGNTGSTTVTVGPGISISPSAPATPPNGSIAFSAAGGSDAGFAWSLSTNDSGATIDGSTGAYTAGATGNTVDNVGVLDSLGNAASVNVSVGGGLAINPATPSSPPKGSIAFSVVGGSGTGFTWALATNDSGGTIDSASGAYTAGPTPSVTDVVRVTDSLGNHSSVNVTVTATVSISPSTATLSAGHSTTFSASGGSGTGYVWSLATNASGGDITSGGVYTAGVTGGIDVVQLVDSLGNSATATVTVTDVGIDDAGSPPPPPHDASTVDAGAGAESSGGCGCTTAGRSSSSKVGLLSLLGALALWRRRKKRHG